MVITANILLKSGFSKMEKIAEGDSDFGDFKVTLFRASNGHYFIRYIPLQGNDKPHIEWLSGNEHLEWLRRLAYNQQC